MIPRTRNSLISTLRSALFWTISLAFNIVIFTVIFEFVPTTDLHGLVVLDLRPLTESQFVVVRVLGWLVAAFFASLLGNFFYYLLHRSQHAVPALWRMHRVHHSITEMSAVSSYHHVFEEFLQYFCVLVPLALLLRVDSGSGPWIILAIAATPIWDVLFGTAYFPGGGEWPAVGLADVPEPKNAKDYLALPFRDLPRT